MFKKWTNTSNSLFFQLNPIKSFENYIYLAQNSFPNISRKEKGISCAEVGASHCESILSI